MMDKYFSTHIRDEAIKRKKLEMERLRQSLLRNAVTVIAELRRTVSFKDAFIFGSLTKPFKFGINSDIDIAFSGLKDRDFFKAASFISSEIGREVDVIQLEGFRFAEKIKKEGIKWKPKNMPF